MRFCVFSYPNFTKISRNGRISVPKNTSSRSQKIKPKYDPMRFFLGGGWAYEQYNVLKYFVARLFHFGTN